MKTSISWIAAGLAAVCGVAYAAQDADGGPSLRIRNRMSLTARAEYREAIQRTAQMVNDGNAQSLASKYGLNILNLTWEDPGRYKGSSVGPNISDMTIQVGLEDPQTRQFAVTCMPVIRNPNFSDKTCDIDPEDFTLLVGNQRLPSLGGPPESLQRVSLYDFLREPTRFLSKPESWLGSHKTLLAPRDSKVLVSAQACFLPVPKAGAATFNPVIFNYHSVSGNPAVLTILATREGTSTTIIDNKRDAFASGIAWGQRLFHNQSGMRTSLTGQRYSDYQGGGQTGNGKPGETISGMNMVLLIQVPLKYDEKVRRKVFVKSADPAFIGTLSGEAAKRGSSDVENAVIGHGEMEGPFAEIDNLNIERDPNYPIRVTVQFYKATSNGIVSAADMDQIHNEIDQVYAQSDSVGSLVTGRDTGRVTEYYGSKVQPADWWQEFWKRHEQNTGDTREQAMAKLRRLLGNEYTSRPVSDLYLRNLLRNKAR
jgi:hypothetical protein